MKGGLITKLIALYTFWETDGGGQEIAQSLPRAVLQRLSEAPTVSQGLRPQY